MFYINNLLIDDCSLFCDTLWVPQIKLSEIYLNINKQINGLPKNCYKIITNIIKQNLKAGKNYKKIP